MWRREPRIPGVSTSQRDADGFLGKDLEVNDAVVHQDGVADGDVVDEAGDSSRRRNGRPRFAHRGR